MDRRTFVKGAVLSTAAVLASGKGLAYTQGEPDEGALLKLQNREDPSVLEKKHVPAIEAPSQAGKGEWFDVKVNVGFMTEHPSTPEHWITSIRLLVNKIEVAAQEHVIGGISPSSATFRLKLEGTSTLEAVESCNLHGTWISDAVTVTV